MRYCRLLLSFRTNMFFDLSAFKCLMCMNRHNTLYFLTIKRIKKRVFGKQKFHPEAVQAAVYLQSKLTHPPILQGKVSILSPGQKVLVWGLNYDFFSSMVKICGLEVVAGLLLSMAV